MSCAGGSGHSAGRSAPGGLGRQGRGRHGCPALLRRALPRLAGPASSALRCSSAQPFTRVARHPQPAAQFSHTQVLVARQRHPWRARAGQLQRREGGHQQVGHARPHQLFHSSWTHISSGAVARSGSPKVQVANAPGSASSTGSTGGPASTQPRGDELTTNAAKASPAVSLSLCLQKDPTLAASSPVSVDLRLMQHGPAGWSPVTLHSLAARLSTFAAESPQQGAAPAPADSPVLGLVAGETAAPAEPAAASASAQEAVAAAPSEDASSGSSCTSPEKPAARQPVPGPAVQQPEPPAAEQPQPAASLTPLPMGQPAVQIQQGSNLHSLLVSGFADRTYCVHGLRSAPTLRCCLCNVHAHAGQWPGCCSVQI